MEVPQLAIFFGFVSIAIGLAAAILIVIPATLRSLFRYKLWRIRDAAMDDVLSDRLPDVPVVQAFINGIEGVLASPGHMTMLRWLAFSPPESTRRAARRIFHQGLQSLTPEQQDLLADYLNSFVRAVTKHLLIGAPSGWIASVLIFPAFIYRAVSRFVSQHAEPLRAYAAEACDAIIAYSREKVLAWLTGYSGQSRGANDQPPSPTVPHALAPLSH